MGKKRKAKGPARSGVAKFLLTLKETRNVAPATERSESKETVVITQPKLNNLGSSHSITSGTSDHHGIYHKGSAAAAKSGPITPRKGSGESENGVGSEMASKGDTVCVKDNVLGFSEKVVSEFCYSSKPFQLLGKTDETSEDCRSFFKGVKFSGDGSCVLSCGDDNILRIFETASIVSSKGTSKCFPKSVLQISEGECIYDYGWYPNSDSSNPVSCCFASISKDHPLHLWDAYNGSLRATYSPIDEKDELARVISLSFNPFGNKIVAGGESCIFTFDTSRPGTQTEYRKTVPTKKSKEGQRGLISCFAFKPDMSGLIAAGSYSKSICLYEENYSNRTIAELTGHKGGITSLLFTPDCNYLLSGSRKEDEIFLWDMRMSLMPVCKYQRRVETNQRIYFDVDSSGKYMVTGSTDGIVRLYDVLTGSLVVTMPPQHETVNGATFHPRNKGIILISTGQRHFQCCEEVSDSENENGNDMSMLNSIQMWTQRFE